MFMQLSNQSAACKCACSCRSGPQQLWPPNQHHGQLICKRAENSIGESLQGILNLISPLHQGSSLTPSMCGCRCRQGCCGRYFVAPALAGCSSGAVWRLHSACKLQHVLLLAGGQHGVSGVCMFPTKLFACAQAEQLQCLPAVP